MLTFFFFIFFLLTSSEIAGSSSHPHSNRRVLHQPLFPVVTEPPAEPPISPLPKYPSSSSNSGPFFPFLSPPLPPPPPPPTTSSSSPGDPTFPANISSFLPHPHPSSSSSKKLIPAIILPILSLLFLSLAFFLFYSRRRRPLSGDKSSITEERRLFPATSETRSYSIERTEFSYLGNLASSKGTVNGGSVGSPELRPLPPLPRPLRRGDGEVGFSSEEEFFSPPRSSLGSGSISRRTLPGDCRFEPKIASLSSTSSPSSDSAPSEIEFIPPPPPPPLPLPPQNAMAAAPPPPPPPPPPKGYWESRVSRASALPREHPPPPPPVFSLLSGGPPPPPAAELNDGETPRPKLKPLHWDKVRASSDRAMVWDQLKSSSFQLNEEMIETLFVCNVGNAPPKETAKRLVPPSPKDDGRVLDPKKSQNIAILLRALNVTKEEVCEALVEGNAEYLGAELLETLLKMEPSKEEELKLKEHREESSPFKLGPPEKFLKAVLDIPFAFKRADAMLYIASFDSEITDLRKSFKTLETACEELRSSRMFLKLLEAVLKTGNRMNVGTDRGCAQAFKLDTLLKLVDIKGTDGKTTLLHFVVQEIIRSEDSRFNDSQLGLQSVSGLGGELSNVKKAATMDAEVLAGAAGKLAAGMKKVSQVLDLAGAAAAAGASPPEKFREAMLGFLRRAEDEVAEIRARENVVFSLVKEITEYFHGNSAKEEAHPLRIFMVVRDFLSVLERVCKEVGKVNEKSNVSWPRQLPMPVNPTTPQLFPRFHSHDADGSSDDDDSSCSF